MILMSLFTIHIKTQIDQNQRLPFEENGPICWVSTWRTAGHFLKNAILVDYIQGSEELLIFRIYIRNEIDNGLSKC